jgi:hypothetical protein
MVRINPLRPAVVFTAGASHPLAVRGLDCPETRPHRPSAALWSVLALNLLPLTNLFSLVMDGAMVTATLCVV